MGKNVINRFCAQVFVFLIVLPMLGAHAPTASDFPRLAVGVYRDGALDDSLTERLDVALAAEPDVAIVDRRLLARLFDEWQIGATAGDPRNVLEMGRLQGVNYFVWVDVPTDSASGFMEIVDTATGFGVAGMRTPIEFTQLRDFLLSQIRRLPTDAFAPDTGRPLAVSRPAITPDIPETASLTRRLMHDLSEALIAARIPVLHRHRVEQLVSESWRAQKGVVELTDFGRGLRGAGAILVPRISFETTPATLELALVDAVTGKRLAADTWALPIDDGRLLLPLIVVDWTREKIDDLAGRIIVDQTPDFERLQPETLEAFYRGVLLFNEGRYLEAFDYFAESNVNNPEFRQPICWIRACFAATGFEEVVDSLKRFTSGTLPHQTRGINLLGLTCRDQELLAFARPLLYTVIAELNAQGYGPVFLSEDLSILKHEYDALVGIETVTDAGWRRAPSLLFENMISAHLYQDQNGKFIDLVRIYQSMPSARYRVQIQLDSDHNQWQAQIAQGIGKVFDDALKIQVNTTFTSEKDETNIFELYAELQDEFKNATWLKLIRRHPVLGARSGSFVIPVSFAKRQHQPGWQAWPGHVKRGLDKWLMRVLPDDDPLRPSFYIQQTLDAYRSLFLVYPPPGDAYLSMHNEMNSQMRIVAERFPEHPIGLAVRFYELLFNLSPENYLQSREELEAMIEDERSGSINNRLRSLHAALSVVLGKEYELPISRRGVYPSEIERASELAANNRWFAGYGSLDLLRFSDFLLGRKRVHQPRIPRSRIETEVEGQLFLQRLPERFGKLPPRNPIARANEVLEIGSGFLDVIRMTAELLADAMSKNTEGTYADDLLVLYESYAAEIIRFCDSQAVHNLRGSDARYFYTCFQPLMRGRLVKGNEFERRLWYCSDAVRRKVVPTILNGNSRRYPFLISTLVNGGWLEQHEPAEAELLAAAEADWKRGFPSQRWQQYMEWKRSRANADEWRQLCTAHYQRLLAAKEELGVSQAASVALLYLAHQFYLMGDEDLTLQAYTNLLAWIEGKGTHWDFRAHTWCMLVFANHRFGNLPHAFRLAQEALDTLGENAGPIYREILIGGYSSGSQAVGHLRRFVKQARENPNLPFTCPIGLSYKPPKQNRVDCVQDHSNAAAGRRDSTTVLQLEHNGEGGNELVEDMVISPVEIALGHSCPGVAVEAVAEINDQEELARVTLQSKYWNVRTAAVQALTMQQYLAQIAVESRDSNVRYTAMTKLSDPELLANVALASRDWQLRQDIITRLENPAVLAHLAVEDPVWVVRQEAVKKINDQELLRQIAINEAGRDVRVVAVGKINDQDLLARTAEHDSDALVRSVAAGKLTDQNLLAQIAMTDSNPHVRAVAGKRISDREILDRIGMWFSEDRVRTVDDPALLADLISNAPIKVVRFAALARIGDEDLRNLVDLKAATESASLEAVQRFDDPAWLAKMAIDGCYAKVRKAALDNTNDQRLLAKIIAQTKDWNIRVSAMKRLTDRNVIAEKLKWIDPWAVRQIDDSETIRQLSMKARDPYIRHAAVGKLEDQDLLARIASEDRDTYVRSEAVKKLNDRVLLTQFALRDRDEYVRYAAAGRLHADDLLHRIAIENHSAFVQRAASRQITNSVMLAKTAETADHVSVRRTAIEGLSAILPPDISLELRYPRTTRINILCATLPECDEIQWGLRHHAWFSPRVAVAGAGYFEKRFAIPQDYEVFEYADDTLMLWAYKNGKPVAQGTTTFRLRRPYPPSSLKRAMTEATYGGMRSRRNGDLIALLKGAQPDLPIAHLLNEPNTKTWDVAIIDSAWLDEQDDTGQKAVMDFLARDGRSALLAGAMVRNPFIPAWAMPNGWPDQPQSDQPTTTNNVIAVDVEHATLRKHNAADWLTVNDWNHAPPVVPSAGEDNSPMNLRPVYADGVSGAPFIIELFPPEGGRLLCIPSDLAAALYTERFAGYLLYRALQYLGQQNQPQWRDVAYRDHPDTKRWLRTIGVASPQAIGGQDVPDRIDQFLFLRSKSIDAPLERWLRLGGTAIRLTNKRGPANEPTANDRYRGLLRGISMPLIANYAKVLDEDEQAWQSLLPTQYDRRPLIPGVMDEINIDAGRLLVLAVPDEITSPARNLLSILLTTHDIKLGSNKSMHNLSSHGRIIR